MVAANGGSNGGNGLHGTHGHGNGSGTGNGNARQESTGLSGQNGGGGEIPQNLPQVSLPQGHLSEGGSPDGDGKGRSRWLAEICQRGRLSPSDRFGMSWWNAEAEEEAWRSLLSEAELEEQVARDAKRFRVYSAQGLSSARFERRYLIPGVLAAGQPGGVFGAFKMLKTSCTIDLLVSVATGTPFLGRFPVLESGPVMFFSGESGLANLQSIVRRVCAARQVVPDEVQGFSLSPDLPRLDRPRDAAVMRKFIDDRGLKVLAIDPAYLAMDLGENAHNLFYVGRHLRTLAELSSDTGCTLLIVHHCKRRGITRHEPANLLDVAWTGFAEFAAQWVLLSRRWPFDPATGRHELWASFGGWSGHAGHWALDITEATLGDPPQVVCPPEPGTEREPLEFEGGIVSPEYIDSRGWDVVVESPAQAREEMEGRIAEQSDEKLRRHKSSALLRDRMRVMQLLADFPEGETANYLRDRLGLSGGRMRRFLDSLLDSGAITETEIIDGRRGARGYRLVGHRSRKKNTLPQTGD